MPERPPPSALSILLATGMIMAMLVLAIPGIASVFTPSALITATTTIPTAIVITPALITTAAPATATTTPAGPPAGARGLPSTLPAGATADDRLFTVYAGWLYVHTGVRQADSCELEIWPDGHTRSDHLWVDCSPLGL